MFGAQSSNCHLIPNAAAANLLFMTAAMKDVSVHGRGHWRCFVDESSRGKLFCSWMWLRRGPDRLKPSDSAPVLQYGGGPSSDFLAKILGVDTPLFLCDTQFYIPFPSLLLHKPHRAVVPKVWGAPPGRVQEILKGGARGAKLFYSQKINKKHKYN
jgi:hypothetical protein